MTVQTRIQSIDDVLSRLSKVKEIGSGEYEALCPAHNDTKPSLHIRLNKSKILLSCKAGCPNEDIVKALGLTMVDLFLDHSPALSKKIDTTYPYHGADGKVIFEVVRYEPKGFTQRQPDGDDGWIWNLTEVKRVLYHLPDILKGSLSDTVYLVEGEKCCDALWEIGLVATTSPGGAGNWKPEYAEYLRGRYVVIIPDNDLEGLRYARQAAGSLRGIAREVKAIILPGLGPKEDIIQWLEKGGFIDDLPRLEQDASVLFQSDQPNYRQEGETISWQLDNGIRFTASDIRQERTGVHARLEIHAEGEALSWSVCNTDKHEDRVRLANAAHSRMEKALTEVCPKELLHTDLDKFCLGLWNSYLSHFMPDMVEGSEDNQQLRFLLRPYVIEGGGTILFAPPGRGKSYTALLWAVSIDAGVVSFWQTSQVPTLFINLERSGQSLKRRLAAVNRILGLDPKRPLLILNARGKSLYDVLPVCRKSMKQYGIRFVVLDSISRAGFGDLTENRPVNAIVDALSGLCDSWLALAHTPRQNETHVYGSIHFEAGADIVVQLLSQQKEDGTLGLGYQSQKQNDIPSIPLTIYALEFTESGLSNFRKAKAFEFADIEEKQKKSIDELVTEYILEQDSGDATATEIAEALGLNRANLSHLLRNSDKYIQTRKEARKIYYGVKANLC